MPPADDLPELRALPYEVGGASFTGFLADGARDRRAPGVLVAHEGAGLTEHLKQTTRCVAALGTVAFALDLFGLVEYDLERAKAIVKDLRADRAELRRRARAALDLLLAQPGVDPGRVAAIGYCFGGTAVLELARSGAELACVVGFHAGLDAAPGDASAVRGKVLVCQGHDDPVVPAASRDAFAREMQAAGVDWQMLLLGGVGHSFTNPEIDAWGFPGFAFDATADRRSWAAMLRLFGETLGPLAADQRPAAARR